MHKGRHSIKEVGCVANTLFDTCICFIKGCACMTDRRNHTAIIIYLFNPFKTAFHFGGDGKNLNNIGEGIQTSLAEKINNCYFVDNSQYLITKWNPTTNKVDVLGSDQYHWNQNDMLEIGNNVGTLFLDEIVKKFKPANK